MNSPLAVFVAHSGKTVELAVGPQARWVASRSPGGAQAAAAARAAPPAGACSRPGPPGPAMPQGGGGAADAGRPDGDRTGGPDPDVRGRAPRRRPPAVGVRPALGERLGAGCARRYGAPVRVA